MEKAMTLIGRPPIDPAVRLMNRVTKTNTCWRWTGAVNNCGYGKLSIPPRGKQILAHRLSYLLFVGDIPKGYELDHLCRVRECVNPEHLEAVLHKENMRRRVDTRKGTV